MRQVSPDFADPAHPPRRRAVSIDRLILGTAQFGQPYGLGAGGQGAGLALARLHALLAYAHGRGLTTLDTARSYGASEAIIGQWMAREGKSFRIVSKFSKLAGLDAVDAVARVAADLSESRRLLGQECLEAVLAHHPDDILRPEIADLLSQQQAGGRIGSFGASVYTLQEAERALGVAGLSVLQVPVSIMNQAFLASPLLAWAAAAGIRIFARSIFTQGLVFLDPDNLPIALPETAHRLHVLRQISRTSGFDLTTLALAPLAVRDDLAGLVVGCDSPAQLDLMLKAIEPGRVPADLMQQVLTAGFGIPGHETDPRQWQKGR